MPGRDDLQLESKPTAKSIPRQRGNRDPLGMDATVTAAKVATAVGVDGPQRMLRHDQPHEPEVPGHLQGREVTPDVVPGLVLVVEPAEQATRGLDVPRVGIDGASGHASGGHAAAYQHPVDAARKKVAGALRHSGR